MILTEYLIFNKVLSVIFYLSLSCIFCCSTGWILCSLYWWPHCIYFCLKLVSLILHSFHRILGQQTIEFYFFLVEFCIPHNPKRHQQEVFVPEICFFHKILHILITVHIGMWQQLQPMEKDRVVKKDISQQEVIDYFQQQRPMLSKAGFVLAFVNIVFDVNRECVFWKHRTSSCYIHCEP